MIFDIIPISESEVESLDVVQCKLLRTAQQKKNELRRKLDKELAEIELLCYSNHVEESTIYSEMKSELKAEYEYQVEILREQLLFNMSAREPSVDDELGDSGNDSTGYVVDYRLSYVERYIAVRDYYFSIEDPNERFALFRQDMVAYEYLGSYYNTLFHYIYQFTQK